jgi:hypothetical protein
MKEIYLYEFNFIVNVIFPLVMFLGGMILNNYIIHINRKKRIQERRIKKIQDDIRWQNIKECQAVFK